MFAIEEECLFAMRQICTMKSDLFPVEADLCCRRQIFAIKNLFRMTKSCIVKGDYLKRKAIICHGRLYARRS